MTAIDLFCGAGGLSLGAARAGLNVVAGVELDEQALATHTVNFPNTKHLQWDIAEVEGAKLLAEVGLKKGELTALIGGPPCQGFSVIGAQDPADERNALFGHFMRLVGETNPLFFVAENVPGISQEKNRSVLASALALIPKQYEMLEPLIVEGHQYGAPTSRKRLFFVGVDTKRLPMPEAKIFAPNKAIKKVNVQLALKGLPTQVSLPSKEDQETHWRKVSALPNNQFFKRVEGIVPRGVGHIETLKRFKTKREVNGHLGVVHAADIAERYGALLQGEKDPVSRSVRLRLDGYCPTLRSGTGFDKGRRQAVRPIHPTQARVITPREAARLQGFPDWFLLPETKWHSFRQIGNSVSPIVAERVLSALVAHVKAHLKKSKVTLGSEDYSGEVRI